MYFEDNSRPNVNMQLDRIEREYRSALDRLVDEDGQRDEEEVAFRAAEFLRAIDPHSKSYEVKIVER